MSHEYGERLSNEADISIDVNVFVAHLLNYLYLHLNALHLRLELA